MKDAIIVNLVSDQTIPNVQFIKWFVKQNLGQIKVLLVTTKEMERKDKSNCIKNALSSLENFLEWETLTTDGNSLPSISKDLEKYFLNQSYKKIIANITGGTKLMSLAAFDFFKNQTNVEIYYQPIGQELQKLFPVQQNYSINELLSLEEYMNAHGIKFKYSNNCVRDWEYNKSVYENAVLPNRELIKGMLALQNDPHFKGIYKRKDFVDFTLIDGSKFEAINSENATKENMCSLLQSFDFDIHKVEKKDIRYITGGWFEEYVYQKICNEYTNVDAKNVALNVSIEKGDDKNELDVIYLDKENKLHIVECKSFVEGQEGIKVLNDALYKAQAIIKSKFGLFVKQHLFTKSVVEKQPQLNRAREFGIDLKDGNEI